MKKIVIISMLLLAHSVSDVLPAAHDYNLRSSQQPFVAMPVAKGRKPKRKQPEMSSVAICPDQLESVASQGPAKRQDAEICVICRSVAMALVNHQPAGNLPGLHREVQDRDLVALRLAK